MGDYFLFVSWSVIIHERLATNAGGFGRFIINHLFQSRGSPSQYGEQRDLTLSASQGTVERPSLSTALGGRILLKTQRCRHTLNLEYALGSLFKNMPVALDSGRKNICHILTSRRYETGFCER